jgi:hypothetical protein
MVRMHHDERLPTCATVRVLPLEPENALAQHEHPNAILSL